MKLTVRTLFVLAFAAVLMTYSGCKKSKSEAEPVTDQQIDLLNNGGTSWKVQQVTRDGNDTTVVWQSFLFTLAGVHGSTSVPYSCTGRPTTSCWESSGSLILSATNPTTQMTRDDGVLITYSVTSTQLKMSFTFSNTTGYSRVANVTGNWVFTLIPN